MTAIGFAYKSEREEVNGWESVFVEPSPRLKAAYETAKADAEDAWDWFYLMVEQWEYAKMRYGDGSDQEKFHRGLMNDHKTIAERADEKKAMLYAQMNCDHEFDDYPTNEPDNVTMICRKCGLKE